MTRIRLAGVALGLTLVQFATHAHALAEAARTSFEYLHVEANEGGSSGGHAAIRFGAQTFHFQFHEGGVLRLQRDDSDAFVRTYAQLQNRPIHVQQVDVSEETYALLRRRFNDRFLLEERQFAILATLQRDRDLLAQLSGAAPGPATLELRVAGLFEDSPRQAAPEPLFAAVVARAEQRYGAGVVARRRAESAAALAGLVPAAAELASAPPGPHAYASAPPSFAQHAAELLEATAALDVLAGRTSLRDDAVRPERGDELALAPDEIAQLRGFAGALEGRAAELVGSARPDWGSALLLTLARLATLARSAASGRLVVLDAYPADAVRLTPAAIAAQEDLLPGLLADARADLAAARRALRAAPPLGEADYTALETAANRYLELAQAREPGASLRLARGPLLPSRGALRPLPATVQPTRERFAEPLASANARVEAYASELRALYSYELLERNCVSEIFHEIAAALAPAATPDGILDCSGSAERLGGCIDPSARLRFIPFVSAAAVAAEYPVGATHRVASFREAALAAMYAHENGLAVFLRESNVLTSTIYRRHADDSPFLFFTDDAVLTRPLFGAANLVTGLGASLAGLVLLPTGDAELLLQGLRGALFSVPELAFVNLRKGSFAYVPRAGTDAQHDATATFPESAERSP